jgi:hypothetical protein
LQVGWLDDGHGSEPVFLDCWVVPPWMEGRSLTDLRREHAGDFQDESSLWSTLYQVQPAYQLYRLDASGQREDISEAYGPPNVDEEGEFDEPVPSLAEMLPEELRACFSSTLVQDEGQQMVEVSPKGGTLVIFDSAVVPHRVTPVVEGDRIALFGFFAEDRQVPSAWLDPDGEYSECGAWFHDGRAHTDC